MSKSVEELFRNSPEDATHYAKHCHNKVIGDTWMVHISDNEWVKSDSMYNGQIKPSDIIERPKQPIAWSGDGSIPMGAEVEIHHSCWNASEWLKCKILYMSDVYVIVNHWGLDEQHYHASDITVRAIPTQAQLRESAICELMDIAQVDFRVTAARLVDAGFKREVV